MSVVGDIVGSVFGSRASNKAADAQRAAGDQAIIFAEESRDIAREDLQPFREAGVSAVDQLTGLVTDPQQQRKFIEENPFFDALAQRATETVLQNQAAQGRVGSGNTAEALQNSLVLLGSDLLNQRIAQSQNLAGLGQAAAAGQAQLSQQTAGQVGDVRLQQGNVSAAGQIGKANAISQGISGLSEGAGAVVQLLCDYHAKENIKKVGRLMNGLALYKFNYKGEKTSHINVMAQDVEQYFPDAIIYRDGLKYVNMEMIKNGA